MSEVVGKVAELWVFPVKSMGGVQVDAVQVREGGLEGDRAWSVVDARDGSAVTAKQAPTLRQVTARPAGDDVALDVPGEGTGLRGEAADRALSSFLGRAVRLQRAEGERGYVDVAAVHVVSRGSIADAAHAEECDACDVTAPRANVVLDLLDAGDVERGWVEHEVSLGGAGVRITRVPRHCLGVYAEVPAPGPVATGDQVAVRARTTAP